VGTIHHQFTAQAKYLIGSARMHFSATKSDENAMILFYHPVLFSAYLLTVAEFIACLLPSCCAHSQPHAFQVLPLLAFYTLYVACST